MAQKDDFLLDALSDMGVVNESQIAEARQLAESAGAGVVDTLVVNKSIKADDITRARALLYHMEVVDLRDLRPRDTLLKALPRHIARRFQVVPLSVEDDYLTLALSDPSDMDTIDGLQQLLSRYTLIFKVASLDQLKAAFDRMYGTTAVSEGVERMVQELSQTQVDLDSVQATVKGGSAVDADEDAPLVKLVNKIIADGQRLRCSDIHIEPMETYLRIRYRIDGVMQKGFEPPHRLQGPILQRIKIISGMNIAEKRVPQDGRLQQSVDDKPLDFRVSCLPTQYGESIVMRILDKSGLKLGLDQLGFMRDDQEKFERSSQMPDGIMLVTGPTGSGKTTTLYSCLNFLNTPDKKIITVEDPVEYRLDGINQVQVNELAGLTFSAALRSMLRQAPNIIMLGEIRDAETGSIAVNASLTGHFVFSTLHTNDAPSAVTRMVDIGIKPFLVAAATRCIIAQRLVRRFCPKCITEHTLSPGEVSALDFKPEELAEANCRRGAGCRNCNGRGYRGRFGIFEVFELDDLAKRMVIDNATSNDLREQAKKTGMKTLREDGRRKVLAGMTSVDEVMRSTLSDTE
ncbi:MAG: type II/IV secretion system protein [Pedosphaera sp.]|nr:type II/IV secretion system protein [Pedosphaera sp.]